MRLPDLSIESCLTIPALDIERYVVVFKEILSDRYKIKKSGIHIFPKHILIMQHFINNILLEKLYFVK